MIDQQIKELNMLYAKLDPTYRHNMMRFEKDLELTVEKLEKICKRKFSKELKYFLQWLCPSPAHNMHFLPFIEGKDFFVWSNRTPIMKLIYKQEKIVSFMEGHFDLGHERFLFKVCIDFDNSIYVLYGIPKPDISSKFTNPKEVQKVVLANNIDDFLTIYIDYLKNLPVKTRHIPKKVPILLENPEKLYNYVQNYNWDSGEETLEYIVSSPKCDKATALYIYWVSQPYYYDNTLVHEFNGLPSIIERNFLNNFYADSLNKFDPHNYNSEDLIQIYKIKKIQREIPEHMLQLSI